MKFAESDETAQKGILAVLRQFVDIRWGPIENKHQDLGTDIYVQVRDGGVELGALIGAQVKTGSSYFESPCTDPDDTGWWYAENDKRHFDYWKTHALPHLLVLHDLETNTSYWVHVTPDAVVDTGKGAKILVPAGNTLDAEHLDELYSVASTGRAQIPLEGTVWTGAIPASSADQLRFALIAPRLIAPSRNAPLPDDLAPERVVAMMAQARFTEIRSHQPRPAPVPAPQTLIPSFKDAAASPNWGWRFVAALESRIRHGDVPPLEKAVETADTPDRRAASTVALVSAYIEDGLHTEAIKCLAAALAPDDLAPVDRAWLRLQRARAYLELGDLSKAREDADSALGIRDKAPTDLTASAIDGAAGALIFTTAAWDARDFGSVIKGADTAVSWWRAQMALGGLEAVTERTFRDWALDKSTTIGGEDAANNQLYVAALAAAHAGDHGAWRRFSTMLAQDTLLRFDANADPASVASAVTQLRRAGADKELKQTLVRIANTGPCRAITQAADDFDLGRATYTTIFADLMLVQEGGDLFSHAAAERAVEWLVASFDDPVRLAKLSAARRFDLRAQILETLSGLMNTLPSVLADFVVSRLSNTVLDEQLQPMQIARWTVLLRELPKAVWTQDRIEQLLASGLPAADNPLRYPMLGVAKWQEPGARSAIEADVAKGSLQALFAANYVHDLDGNLLNEAREGLRQKIAERQTDAANGTQMSIGGLDPAYVLGVILLSHPSDEDAKCLADLLADENVSRASKQGLLQLIASRPTQFRALFGDRLLPVVDLAAQLGGGVSVEDPLFNPDTSGEAAFIRETLRDQEPEFGNAFSLLVGGSDEQRMWAAHLVAQNRAEHYAPALLTLVHDQKPLVRAQAAGGLARLAVTDRGGEVVLRAVVEAAADPGRAAPIAVASELKSADTLSIELEELGAALMAHPSAAVRAIVTADN